MKKNEIVSCWLCGSICLCEHHADKKTRYVPLNKAIIESLSWMIEHFKWAHNQSGVPDNYSPQLKDAITLLEALQKGENERIKMHRGKGFEDQLQKGGNVCRP